MKRSHLILFSSVAGLTIAGFVMSAWFWNSLPSQIPVHFNFSGTPDAWEAKNIFYVFLAPSIQLAMLLVFALLYRYPQYSSWPTTLILMAVESQKREKIFSILREMLVLILFWMSLLFSYLQFTILATANGRAFGLANYVMMAFLAVMLVLLAYVNAKMFITIRKMIRKNVD